MVEPCFLVKVGPLSCFCLCSDPGHITGNTEFWVRDRTPRLDSDSDSHDNPPELSRQPSIGALEFAHRKNSSLSLSIGVSALERDVSGTGSEINALLAAERTASGAFDSIDEEAETVEEVQIFKKAVAEGCYLEAYRELTRLEAASIDPVSLLDEKLVSRVRRIWEKFTHSQKMLTKKRTDFTINEKNDSLNLEWGLEMRADGTLLIMYSVCEPDIDVVRCVAALQERDLHLSFDKDLEWSRSLGEETPNDTFWHTFSSSKVTKTKGDNVTITSVIDVLDEPNSMIWSGQYTPSAVDPEINGIGIPPIAEGRSRQEYSFQVATVSPLVQAGKGDRTRGCRLKMVREVKLSPVAKKVISWMPNRMLLLLARGRVEALPGDFRDFVMTSRDLEERLQTSPRSGFYAQLHSRLTA